MNRKALLAAALLTASFGAHAYHDLRVEARVVSVVPYLSLSFGSLYHDGFRVEFESGGQRYYTHSPYRPGPVIIVPPPHRVVHVHRFDHRHGFRDHHRHGGWDDRGRRAWKEHDRWDDRRDRRGDDRRGRDDGRHRHDDRSRR
jgi:hypothetical protein